ncbi:MAG TPA: carboxypeptidase-like regulatory domain-containing protein, partial [Gemmatimonadaceae bacterium]|nr:carboxypeptidase-like regulatory domain-containing protein [Gemmatimonadaceae bacterium]
MRTWMLRMTIATALTLAGAASAFAQATGQITGSVVDSVTSQPLAGAQVVVTGTKLGAVADANGRFTVQGVPAGQVTVRVQRIGYAPAEDTVTVSSGATTTVDFRLEPRAVILKEVVAVGYGTQRKEDVTSAVTSVNSEDFVQAPARDAASLIAGTIPGLSVTT